MISLLLRFIKEPGRGESEAVPSRLAEVEISGSRMRERPRRAPQCPGRCHISFLVHVSLLLVGGYLRQRKVKPVNALAACGPPGLQLGLPLLIREQGPR